MVFLCSACNSQQPASVGRYFTFAFREYRGQAQSAKERATLLCRNVKLLTPPQGGLLIKQGDGACAFCCICFWFSKCVIMGGCVAPSFAAVN